MTRILVTGGAGFIGSAVVRHILSSSSDRVLVLDKLSYAGNLASLAPVADNPRFTFSKTDICDRAALDGAIAAFQPQLIMHLAAESHVDRSIDGPRAFVETNVVGTCMMLEAARHYWLSLPAPEKSTFVFTIFPPMKCSAIWQTTRISSPKPRLMPPAAPILRRKRVAIT